MASARALTVLSAIALGMLAWVAVDDGDRPAVTARPRLVVPEYSRVLVERVVWNRSGEPDVVLTRRGDRLELTAPIAAGADPAAVDDVLGTIEVLTFIRRRSASQLGLPGSTRLTLQLRGRSPVVLSIGSRLPDTDRAWIGRGEHAYLVPGHAARALDRRADDLRARDVFPRSHTEITGIEIERGEPGKPLRELVLSGNPLRVHREGGGKMVLDRAAASALLAAIDSLVLQRFVSAPIAGAGHQLRVRVLGAGGAHELRAGGPCPGAPDLRLVETSIGKGCASRSALERIAALVGKGKELFERRLAPPVPSIHSVTIGAAETITLRAQGSEWITSDDRKADASELNAWLEGLNALGTGSWAPAPARPPSSATTITLTDADGEREKVAIFSRGGTWWALRSGEPLVQRLGGGAAAIARTRALEFRDRQLYAEDPASLISAKASQRGKVVAHVDRGLLLEEWTVRAPAMRKPDPAGIKKLRQLASRLRARRFVDDKPRPQHGLTPPSREVELLFEAAPTIGAKQAIHRIALAASTRDGGCYGQLDGEPVVFELEPDACAALRSSWSR